MSTTDDKTAVLNEFIIAAEELLAWWDSDREIEYFRGLGTPTQLNRTNTNYQGQAANAFAQLRTAAMFAYREGYTAVNPIKPCTASKTNDYSTKD